ncbi:MAG TPA: SDR family NAD(P)-dependent oxidoreductase [Thermaerobacter sp.]
MARRHRGARVGEALRVLVTGAAGFIGAHVVEALAGEHRVMAVDDFSSGIVQRVGDIAVRRLDVTDPDGVRRVFRDFRPDAVLHLAAQVGVERSPAEAHRHLDVNVYGTMNVLRAAAACGTGRVVFASSAAVYGNPRRLPVDEDHPKEPVSVYGRSKLAAEWLVREYARGRGLEYVILRLGNVYGPRQRRETGPVVASFFLDALKGRGPTIHGAGLQTRDFVYVGDVARAFRLALDCPPGVVANIAGGSATSIRELAEMVCGLVGASVQPRYGPPRPGDIRNSVLVIDVARRQLGWEPAVDLATGLRETFEWYRAVAAERAAATEWPGIRASSP